MLIIILFFLISNTGLCIEHVFSFVSGHDSYLDSDTGTYIKYYTRGRPRARKGGTTWIAPSDNNNKIFYYYLFGGDNNFNYYNDFWYYDELKDSFFWINGSNQGNIMGTENIPGARSGAAIAGISNEFFLFGGMGSNCVESESFLNDFYFWNSSSTSTFTHLSNCYATSLQKGGTYVGYGESGYPSARFHSMAFSLNNTFFLFGGFGYDSNAASKSSLNDLWKFTPKTNEWIWLQGSGQSNYYVKDVFHPLNYPPPRDSGAVWTVKNIAFFFGGIYAPGFLEWRSDLWAYNYTNNTFKWISGSELNTPSVYSNNYAYPGARNWPSFFADENDNLLYLFGGTGYDSNTSRGEINDMFVYSIDYDRWEFIGGSYYVHSTGFYSPPNLKNWPAARGASHLWFNSFSKKFFLFGGLAYDPDRTTPSISDPSPSENEYHFLDDLWVYYFNVDTIEEEIDFFNSITTIIGIYSGFGLLILIGLISFPLVCIFMNSSNNNTTNTTYTPYFFGKAVISIATSLFDIFFLAILILFKRDTFTLLILVLLVHFVFFWFLNMVFLNRFYSKIITVDDTKLFFKVYKFSYCIIFLFSSFNLGFLRIIKSGLFLPFFSTPLRESTFIMPFSRYGLFSNIFQDIPQFILHCLVCLSDLTNFLYIFYASILIHGISFLVNILFPFILFLYVGGGKLEATPTRIREPIHNFRKTPSNAASSTKKSSLYDRYKTEFSPQDLDNVDNLTQDDFPHSSDSASKAINLDSVLDISAYDSPTNPNNFNKNNLPEISTIQLTDVNEHLH